MAVYDNTLSDCGSGSNCGRGYGMLTSNWIGFDNDPKPLYIWDQEGQLINEQNPMRVNSGQQSRWHYVAMGQTETISRTIGLTNDYVTFSSSDPVVDFGADGTMYNTITRYWTWTYFKIRANINDGGLTKYISWNSVD
jgi:hypothetical protein